MRENLKGLAVLGVSVGAMLGLRHAYPALADDRHFWLYAALAWTALALAARAQGVTGKLLFLPSWFVALCAVSWTAGELGGGLWALSAGAGMGALVAGLVAIGYSDEKRSWAEAPRHLEAARSAASPGAFWHELSEAFHVPIGYEFSPKLSAHLLQVLDLAASRQPAGGLPDAAATLRGALEESVLSLEKREIDRKLVDGVAAWLQRQRAFAAAEDASGAAHA